MHCPKCGQQQVSDEIRYCSRCGFLLVGVAEVVANNGIVPGSSDQTKGVSKRTRGLKQSAFIFILGLVLIPIWVAFLVGTNGPPELAIIAVCLFLGSAVIRAAYALLFQSNDPAASRHSHPQGSLAGNNDATALPPQTSIPAEAYSAPGIGGWRETNDLADRPSVTDTTTKLLSEHESR